MSDILRISKRLEQTGKGEERAVRKETTEVTSGRRVNIMGPFFMLGPWLAFWVT
jgi:hypothetical protein